MIHPPPPRPSSRIILATEDDDDVTNKLDPALARAVDAGGAFANLTFDGDVDVFRFTDDFTQNALVTLQFFGQGTVPLALFDSTGTQLEVDAVTDPLGRRVIAFDSMPGDTLLVQVGDPDAALQGGYSLFAQKNPFPGLFQQSGTLVTPGQETSLGQETPEDFLLAGFDATGPGTFTITVDTTWAEVGGGGSLEVLGIDIYDRNGVLIGFERFEPGIGTFETTVRIDDPGRVFVDLTTGSAVWRRRR